MLLAVLTISDRCSQGLMADTAGPAVAEILRRQFPAAVIETELVPDDEDRIVAQLNHWCAAAAALILTAGGTGLSPRDCTPEATRRVLHREAPGLAEAMRVQGAAKNKFAWLSRGVAGLKNNTLIVNLPGSERGAVESLEAILHLIAHGIEVAAGEQGHPLGSP
jgi:molybdopterin adenylyltransferase